MLIQSTAFHSAQFSGTMENRPWRNGVYSRAKWRAMDKLIAYTRIIFSQRGRVRRDSLEDSAFMALSISITTRLDSLVSHSPNR